jgi:hypothetical protein
LPAGMARRASGFRSAVHCCFSMSIDHIICRVQSPVRNPPHGYLE